MKQKKEEAVAIQVLRAAAHLSSTHATFSQLGVIEREEVSGHFCECVSFV